MFTSVIGAITITTLRRTIVAPTITPLATRVTISKMAAEEVPPNVKGSLALDAGKQKEFEEKVKRIKDKVSGIHLVDI